MTVKKSAVNATLPRMTSLAQAVSTVIAGTAGLAVVGQAAAQNTIEEVVVTARKRTENLQDIPQSMQAFTSADIERYGFQNVDDYARFIPSLTHTGATPGQSKIVFRGVADSAFPGIADSSAAVYLDEQPLTMGSQAPDVRLVDIERIEALSGPQGSLYGASSQSGTLRIITNKPNPDQFEANLATGVSTIEDGSESWDFEGMVNYPINDRLAVRVVGFRARDGGYIDNVLSNNYYSGDPANPTPGNLTNADSVESNINYVDWMGARGALRWEINDEWTATVTGVYQNIQANGDNHFDPTVGDLDVVTFFGDSRDDEWHQVNLLIEGEIGPVSILSSTSYFNRDIEYHQDTLAYSAYFDVAFSPYYATYDFGPDPIGQRKYDQYDKRWTQEIRLAHDGSRWDWTVGFFYQHNKQSWDFRSFTNNYVNSPAYAAWSGYYPGVFLGDAWWHSFEDIKRDDFAFFGETTFSFTDKLDVIFGARWYDVEIERSYFVERPLYRADRSALLRVAKEDGFLPKVGLQYNITEDKMVYIIHSQGFRAGGINRSRGEPTFPLQYDGDTLKNFEVGAKTQWLDGRLQVNVSAYRQLWNDYQLEVIDPSFGPPLFQPFQIVVGNVGDAEANGLEWDIQAVPWEGVDVGLSGTWLFKHELSEDLVVSDPRVTSGPALFIPAGTTLPLTPDLNLSAFFQYSWPLGFLDGDAYFRFQYSYTGDSVNMVEPNGVPAPKLVQADYHIGDLKLGMAAGTWEGELFLNNVWDERAEIWRQVDEFETYWGHDRVVTNRPRQLGLKIRKRW